MAISDTQFHALAEEVDILRKRVRQFAGQADAHAGMVKNAHQILQNYTPSTHVTNVPAVLNVTESGPTDGYVGAIGMPYKGVVKGIMFTADNIGKNGVKYEVEIYDSAGGLKAYSFETKKPIYLVDTKVVLDSASIAKFYCRSTDGVSDISISVLVLLDGSVVTVDTLTAE